MGVVPQQVKKEGSGCLLDPDDEDLRVRGGWWLTSLVVVFPVACHLLIASDM